MGQTGGTGMPKLGGDCCLGAVDYCRGGKKVGTDLVKIKALHMLVLCRAHKTQLACGD